MKDSKRQKGLKKSMAEKVGFTVSGGNVFQDLKVKDPELHQLKAELGLMIIDLIEKRELTQTRAAALLSVSQPEVSRLKGGNLSHYGVERLLGFLNRLDQRVEISIKPSTKSKAPETVIKK